MRKTFLLFIFFPLLGYSQNDSIKILLKSDSIIYTNYLEQKDDPFFKDPFITIHVKDGKKIKLKDIQYYEGFDLDGVFKKCNVIDLGFQNKYVYTKREFKIEKTSKLEIFYDQITFSGKENTSTDYNYLRYRINNSEIKKVNYKNLKIDLSANPNSIIYLKKSNTYRIGQIITTSLGILLASKVIIDVHNDGFHAKHEQQNDLTYAAAGILIISPIFLEIPKKRNYLKALRNY